MRRGEAGGEGGAGGATLDQSGSASLNHTLCLLFVYVQHLLFNLIFLNSVIVTKTIEQQYHNEQSAYGRTLVSKCINSYPKYINEMSHEQAVHKHSSEKNYIQSNQSIFPK